MKRVLLIEGTVTEIKSDDLLTQPDVAALQARLVEYERVLRLFLKYCGYNKSIAEQAYAALGEPYPSIRILKGKIPRYQQVLIDDGKLSG